MTVHTVRVVDLGFAVAKVKRDDTLLNGPYTTLTLMTPADAQNGSYEPAHSAIAWMNPAQTKALIDALTDETSPVLEDK